MKSSIQNTSKILVMSYILQNKVNVTIFAFFERNEWLSLFELLWNDIDEKKFL